MHVPIWTGDESQPAKTAAVTFVRRAAAHLGMSPGHYRAGHPEVAGAVGLLPGLAGASSQRSSGSRDRASTAKAAHPQ